MFGCKLVELLQLYGVDLLLQTVMCAHAIKNKTEHFYDLTGSMTFVLLTALSVYPFGKWKTAQHITMGNLPAIIPSVIALIWAVRLGTYLYNRVTTVGHDTRFSRAKKNPAIMATFWFVQSLWVFFTLLPVMYVNLHAQPIDAKKGNLWRDLVNDKSRLFGFVAGLAISLGGLALESVADFQKFNFKNDNRNRDRFINVGVWRYLRYPNYAGEILVWIGQYLMCQNIMHSIFTAGLFLISPIFVTALLLFVSGIPIQEKQAQQRWGNNIAYQKFKANTKMLIPGVY